MKKLFFLALAFLLFSSHDMYLKLDTYFLAPNTASHIQLFNGTFDTSENTIDRNRMIDVSLVGNGERIRVDSTQWREDGGTTILDFTSGESGTWVAGVSTRPRNIEMTAEDFNGYLEHDGVLDMLTWRQENEALEEDAIEKYSKHVKTIFQVGDKTTADWQTVLGYPIEFVPLENPYDMHPGHDFQVQLLFEGKPLSNQLVYVGSVVKEEPHSHGDETHTHGDGDPEHSHEHERTEAHSHGEETHTHGEEDPEHPHEHTEAHSHGDETHTHGDEEPEHSHEHAEAHSHDAETHTHGDEDREHSHEHPTAESPEHAEESHSHSEGLSQVRTDANGILTVNLTAKGIWYLRTIHLVNVEEEGLTHESNWATLTFEVGEGHKHEEEHHHHDDDHGEGIPSYAYWILSLAVIAGLYVWFNRSA